MNHDPSPSPPAPAVLALVPAYNEAGAVADVICGAKDHLPVLVVDDGSADGTGDRAVEAGAEVLRQEPNQGKGMALKRGFSAALDRGMEAVITLDADGQHDPAEIPAFLAARAATGAELIIGERDFSGMPPLRRLANWLGRWIFSWAVGRTVRDNQSGYRLIGRRLMAAMLDSTEAGFELEVEMIATCVDLNLPMAGVPIRTIYADEVSHIRNRRHMVKFLRMAWRTRRRRRKRVPTAASMS